MTINDIQAELSQRKRLRAEGGLPLLENPELIRLRQVEREAEFELVWARQRYRFEHRWMNNKDGWIANMGFQPYLTET